MLQLLTALPITGSERGFDKSPPIELFALSRISLLGRITELVRNDTIMDMSKIGQLYRALLVVVTKIAKHRGVIKLLTEK
jgi:hypothetical protein